MDKNIMITETLTQASQVLDAATNLAPKVIGFASIAAAFLPKPENKGMLSKVHRYINQVAFNFKHAANKD